MILYKATEIAISDRIKDVLDHISKTENDHISKTENDHISKTENDHISKTENDHISKTGNDHISKTEKDHISKTEKDHGQPLEWLSGADLLIYIVHRAPALEEEMQNLILAQGVMYFKLC